MDARPPTGAGPVEREERRDQRPRRPAGGRAPVHQKPGQDQAQRRGEREEGEMRDGRPCAQVRGDEWPLEQCCQGGELGMLEDHNGDGLKKGQAELRPAAHGEEVRLAEPGDRAEVQRQQQRHRVEGGATAEADEREVGQREDHEPEDEPTALDEEPEQRATSEDHQRRCLHGRGQPVRKRPHEHERGGNRKKQRGHDDRSGSCHSSPSLLRRPARRHPRTLEAKQRRYQVAFGLFWRCVFANESLGAPAVRRDGTVDRTPGPGWPDTSRPARVRWVTHP